MTSQTGSPGRARMATIGGWLLAAAAAYALVCVLVWVFEERLLFLPDVPGRALETTPQALDLAYDEVTITAADGVRLHAWWVPAPEARWTLLHFHGNAGNISHRLEMLQIFHALDLNVLLFDYRGYGRSEGAPTEQGLQQDADAAWAHLTQQRAIPAARIVIHGQSMGGAIAAWLAARRQPAALVLESAFTSVPDMAAELYPWLPGRWMTKLRFDTRGELARVRCPVLVIHSADDEIIPVAHGQRLFETAAPPKRQVTLAGDHNSGFWVSREVYAKGWSEFLRSLPQ